MRYAFRALLALAALSLATPALAQGGSLPTRTDRNGNTIQATPVLVVDEAGSAAAAGGKQESFAIVTGNTPSAAVTVYGGNYTFTQSCSVYGTLILRYRGPDGATMTALLTKTTADSGGGSLLALGSNQLVDVTLSGTTGCNARLMRNP